MLFPFGWNCSDLSLFLAIDDLPPIRWHLHCKFAFTVVNQKKDRSVVCSSYHTFHNGSVDQGFQFVMKERFHELRDSNKGFLNGKDLTIHVEVEVSSRNRLWLIPVGY